MFKVYAMRSNKNNKPKNKKIRYLVIAVIAALLVGGLLLAAELTNLTNFYSRSTYSTTGQSPEGINYGPPTEEESKAGDDQKQDITDSDETPVPPSPDTANVVVTGAEQSGDTIEVISYVSNVYKDGTCTFSFTHENHTVTKTTAAYRDVSTTICNNPLVPRSEFPAAGDWTVKVSYKSSDGATGQSGPKTFKID